MERWNGSVAVVTGASSGIGVAVSQQLVLSGLIVIGLARRADKMQAEMKDVKGPGQFHAKQCDISNEKDVIDAFNWIESTFKSADVLINNAGTMQAKTIEDSSAEEMENVFKVNVFGLLHCTRQAIKLMKKNQKEGHIINVNSVLGHKIMPGFAASVYPASKFAVTALSESLRDELSKTKIRVTSVSPGAVKTDMFARVVADFPNFQNIPALKPEDVANSIVHALSVPPNVEINEITLTPKHV